MLSGDFPKDLRLLLSDDEKVIWFSRAELKPFVFKRLPSIVFPLMFALISLMMIPLNILTPSLALFIVFWFGVLGSIIFSSTIYPLLLWKNICYVLTNMRIIVRKGVIGIDYDILNLEQIQQININKGVWDRICGTGSIVIQAIGVSPVRIDSIREPFNVQELIARAIKARKNVNSPSSKIF